MPAKEKQSSLFWAIFNGGKEKNILHHITFVLGKLTNMIGQKCKPRRNNLAYFGQDSMTTKKETTFLHHLTFEYNEKVNSCVGKAN